MSVPVVSSEAAELYRAYVVAHIPYIGGFDGSAAPSLTNRCAVCHKMSRIRCCPGLNLTKLSAIASLGILFMVDIFC